MPDVLAWAENWLKPKFEIPKEILLGSERNFGETEPNNSLEQANDVGRVFPNQPIHISGHLNGSSDPYDYFDYTATEPGTIALTMYEGDQIIYEDTFVAQQANDPFYYYGWAEGNEDFDYETFLMLMPENSMIIA